ncbi:MAG: ABC transporter permease subunit [Eubacteriales bacterium]|nr:ABC transporter permease subunit [Eubacteriales bacterium]
MKNHQANVFEKELKSKISKWRQESPYQDKRLARLEAELKAAEARAKFYEPYQDQSNDAKLTYLISQRKLLHLPAIIQNQVDLDKALAEKAALKATAAKQDQGPLRTEIAAYKAERQKLYRAKLAELKLKHREGQISAKALAAERKQEKLSLRDDLALKELEDPVKNLEDQIKALQHRRKVGIKEQYRVMEADISDLHRRIPAEVEASRPSKYLLNLLLPGLGQLANKQYVKALFFFLGSLFIAFAAIPYALGYGNYQGQGVAGLLTLAQGGRRVDRSIIFMIEGIIAIFLLILALAIYYFALRDAYLVEKKQIKGIRPHNWFETKESLESKGFPYIVSTPALLVIIFIVLVPVVTTILLSFTNMDPKNQSKFVWNGLANYKVIAFGQGVAGKAFWHILSWTLIWTLAATTLAILIGFILALLVNQDRIRGKKLWRTIYLLPWAVPAFITIMFFSVMLAPNGMLTEFISGLAGQVVNIKNDTTLTRITLVLLQGWLGSSYIFLLCTGILQSIPLDLYEAAEIDGAGSWQRTRHITIPLMLYQIAPLLVTQYTFNFNNYSIIALFNNGGPFVPSKYGNLAGSSDILISYIFKLTIENQYQALGAAITIIISLVLMFISFLGFRKTKAFNS